MSKVVVYEHKNYAGLSQELGPGTYLTNTLALGADKISSITVPAGWKVALWSEDKLVGASKCVTTNIADLSTIGFNENVASITVACPASEVSRDVAPALGFNGVDTHVHSGPISLDFAGGTFQGLTIEAWVCFDSTGEWARIAEMFDTTTGDSISWMRKDNEKTLRFSTKVGNGDWSNMLVPDAIENGKWTHFAAVLASDGTVTIYRNGSLLGSGKVSVPRNVTRNTLYLGRSSISTDKYFAGQMSDVRIWSYPRSEAEINRTKNTRLIGTERGLLRYYPLDDIGLVARDWTGNANGTISGTATYRLAGPSLGTAPGSTTGMQFDGVSDYVALPAIDADFSKGFTLEAWVYYDGNVSWGRVFDIGNGAPSDNVTFGRWDTSNELTLEVFRGSAAQTLKTSSSVLASNTWQHVAATVDANGLAAIYVNGELRATGPVYTPNGSVVRAKAYLGKNNWAGTTPFKGRLADVRIWTVARTADEINRAKHGRLDTNEPGLFAYYPLTEIGDTVAHDASPAARHASVFPALRWNQPAPTALVPAAIPSDTIAAAPPPVRGSLSFDGVDDYVEVPAVGGDYSQGLTIEAWVYFDGAQSWGRICDFGNGAGSDNIILGRSGTTSEIALEIWRGGTKKALTTTGSVIVNQTWMHVAAVVDKNGLAKIYVNGVVKASGTVWTPNAGIARTMSYLGKNNWGSQFAFKGRMADVRLWTIAKSATEIAGAMSTALEGNEPGLFRHYPLDETSGATARDIVRRNGAIYGGATWTMLPHKDTLRFDGSTHVDMGAIADHLSIELTIEAWVNFETNGSWARIVDLGNGAPSDNILFARSGTTNDLSLRVYRGGTLVADVTATDVLRLNTWMHVAFTMNAYDSDDQTAVFTIYVDGQRRKSTRAGAPNYVTRSKNYIGKSNWSSNPNFKGRMSDVRIWRAARTASQIQSGMYAPPTSSENGLYRHYRLDSLHFLPGGPLPMVADSSSQNTFGMVVGQAAVLSDGRPDGASLVFHGAGTFVDLPAFADDFSKGVTLEAWVYMSGIPAEDETFIDIGNNKASDNITLARNPRWDATLGRNVTSNDLVLRVVGNAGAPVSEVIALDVLRKETWMHLCGTISASGTAKIYIDGTLVKTGTISMPRGNIVRVMGSIGNRIETSTYFQGRMTEVRIWNRERTAAEVVSGLSVRLSGTESGLVRHYPLDSGSGPVARDGVVRNAATVVGTPERFSRPLIGWPPAVPTRGALEFDGVDDYVALPMLKADFSRGFTIEAWVHFDGLGALGWAICDLGNGPEADNIWFGQESSTNGLAMEVWRGNAVKRFFTGSFAIANKTWIHVAATVDAQGVANIYVDGVLKKTATLWTPRAGVNRTKAYLGRNNVHHESLFKGRMADVRIWNRARTVTEIANARTSGLSRDDIHLVAYYRLDETTGNIAHDGSNAKLHANVVGKKNVWGAPAPQFLPAPYTPGALSFDGTNDYVVLPTIDTDLSTNGFTLEAWVYFDAASDMERVFDLGRGAEWDNIIFGRYSTTDRLILAVWRDTTSVHLITQTGVIQPQTWMHVAATVDSLGNGKIYVNGVEKASGVVQKPRTGIARSKAYLGKSNWFPGVSLKGRMAEARIWSVARSVDQINRAKNARLLGSESGLVANYRLNENDGERVGDASKHGRHGYLGGRATWNAPAPEFVTAANQTGILRLDGVNYVEMQALDATRALTLEAWVRCNDVTKTASFIELGNASSDRVYLGHENNDLVLGIQLGTGNLQKIVLPDVLVGSTWTHVAASIDDNGHVVLCKDGVAGKFGVTANASNITTLPSSVTRSLGFLGRDIANTALFQGTMTEVRIWSVARTPKQIDDARMVRLGGTLTGLARCHPLVAVLGTTAKDTTAAGKHGTVKGSAIAWNVTEHELLGALPPTPAPATNPGALVFDGLTTYAQMPAISADLSKGFTIEAWVCFEATSSHNWERIVDIGVGQATDNVYVSRYGTTNRIAVRIYNGSSYTEAYTPSDVIVAGKWMHVAVTQDANRNVAIFIDGVSQQVLAKRNQPTANSHYAPASGKVRPLCFIGRSNWSWDAMFKGRMTEVRIWNVARSASEIGETMKKRLHGAEPGLVVAHRFTEATGNLATSVRPEQPFTNVLGNVVWDKGSAVSYPVWESAIVVAAPVAAKAIPTAPPPTGTPIAQSAVPLNIDDKAKTYNTGVTFDLLGTTAKITASGAMNAATWGQTYLFTGTFALSIGSETFAIQNVTLSIHSTTLVAAVRFNPGNSLFLPKVKSIVASTPGVAEIMNPFMNLLSSTTMIVATGNGEDPDYGGFSQGLNVYSTQTMSSLPVLSSIHNVFPEIGLNNRSLLLYLGLASPSEIEASGTALINSKLIDTSPVKLTFDEMGLDVSRSTTEVTFGARHKFTMELLGETLELQGGVNVQSGGVLEIWGALDPQGGGVWHHPWGIPGIDIGGFGVQIALAKPISIGARGEIHIGGGLLGGSVALNINPLVLVIDSPEGIDLPALINAFIDNTGIPNIDWLSDVFDIRLKNLKLYVVPEEATIAGKTYDEGVGVNGDLSLWGWDASIDGHFTKTSGGHLIGNAEPLEVVVAGVALFEFTDVTGNAGAMVDIEITATRQHIEYSGRLRFLDGLYHKEEALLLSSSGIEYRTETPVGDIDVIYKGDYLKLTWSPGFKFSFSVLGLSVSINVGASILNEVDGSGYSQSLSCWFHVCGVDMDVGPVTWGIPFTSLSSVVDAFEHFFGDLVKSFFTDTLGQAFKAAFDWVKNNITDLAEDAIEIFKSAGAAIKDIAKNIYETFDVAAHEVISFLGTSMAEAASILNDALNLAVTEAAKALGAAFNEGSAAVRGALETVYGNVDEVADEVWDAIDDAADYLDPTNWC